MATVGLKGTWGLEQLDKTGIATWKLGFILMGGGALLGILLVLALGDVNPSSVLASTFTPTLVDLSILVVSIGIAGNLWLTLMESRTTEADLQLLSLTDDVSRATMKQLRPRKKALFTQAIITSVLLTGLVLGIAVLTSEVSISKTLTATYTSGLVLSILFYLLVPIGGLTQGFAGAFIYAQRKSLLYAAQNIEIDLLQLDDYSVIANLAVRIALFSVAIASVFPLMALFSGSAEEGRIIWPMAIAILLM